MKSRLKITANMVTMARIVLLPVPCAFLFYGGEFGRWMAFLLYTLLGATDFVDGAMARREGPTKLGTLIDPIADKLFVASICLALVGLRLMPAWAMMAILSREFFITALRTSVALREETFKTSTIAKIKTFVQMGGFGTVFMTIALSRTNAIIVGTLLFLGVFGYYLGYWLSKRKTPPFWALPTAMAFLYWTCLSFMVAPDTSVFWQFVVIVALTWISCLDYVVSSYKMFLRTGISMIDWVRIAWSISHTLLVAPLVAYYPTLVLPLLLSISFELGLGGIDMVVAAEKKYAGVTPFLVTATAGLGVWVLVFANYLGLIQVPVYAIATLLAAASFSALALTVYRWHFLFRRAFTPN